MLATRIIPCLDVDNGRVVKGVQFVDIVDAGDPIEAAIRYYMQGADEICFLDITASHEGRDTLYDVVEEVARNIFIPLTVGGGIRTLNDIDKLLAHGADKVSINTAAINDPQLVRDASERFGNQCIVVALDAKTTGNTDSGFELFTHGGRKETGLDAVTWAKRMDEYGAGEILLTSMGRDGTRKGYDLPLTRAVCDAITIPVIASGGVGELNHLVEGVTKGHASAVLAASIFHFGEHTVGQAKELMRKAGVVVR